MTYANVVFSYGTERFVKKAAEVGMDGLILPDVPFEEKEEFDGVCKEYGLDLISLRSQKQLLRNPYWNLKIEKLVVTTRVKSL